MKEKKNVCHTQLITFEPVWTNILPTLSNCKKKTTETRKKKKYCEHWTGDNKNAPCVCSSNLQLLPPGENKVTD